MCGICGIAFQEGYKSFDSDSIKSIVSGLLLNTFPRGRVSTGVCFATEKELNVLKHGMPAPEFVKTQEFVNLSNKMIFPDGKNNALKSVIGHCRYPTKGNKEDNHNNHPIVSGGTVGVHNGVIGNDEELWPAFQSQIKRKGKVDTEIIFAGIEYAIAKGFYLKEATIKASQMLRGSYACAFVHKSNPFYLFLFRNHMPCKIISFPEIGMFMFASGMEIIRDAISGYDLGEYEEIEFPENSGVGFNLFSNRYEVFKLNSSRRNYGMVV